MKFLQLNAPNNEPRILELGKDFFNLGYDSFSETIPNLYDFNGGIICNIQNCHQSRPLIEIDSFCEYDVINVFLDYSEQDKDGNWVATNEKLLVVFEYGRLQLRSWNYQESEIADTILGLHPEYKLTSLGSIFTPANKLAHPELYAEALAIVNAK